MSSALKMQEWEWWLGKFKGNHINLAPCNLNSVELSITVEPNDLKANGCYQALVWYQMLIAISGTILMMLIFFLPGYICLLERHDELNRPKASWYTFTSNFILWLVLKNPKLNDIDNVFIHAFLGLPLQVLLNWQRRFLKFYMIDLRRLKCSYSYNPQVHYFMLYRIISMLVPCNLLNHLIWVHS